VLVLTGFSAMTGEPALISRSVMFSIDKAAAGIAFAGPYPA
jgi:hypothetical protein